MADNVWSSPVLVAVASGVSLVLKEGLDRARTHYRQSRNGNRRKPHDPDDHSDLRELISSEANATRAALAAHAEEDSRRFDEAIGRFEADSRIMHNRYHDDSNKLTKLIAEVSLLMQGRIKHG